MANTKTLETLIQFRRGKESEWLAVKDSYIPRAGEPCTTIDGDYAGQIKVGDGIHNWGELSYVGVGDLIVNKIYADGADSTQTVVDGVVYATAAEAIEGAATGSEVVLSGGFGDEVVKIDKEIILNMSDAKILNDEQTPLSIGVNGKVTLKNGEVECNKNEQPAIMNNGEVILDNCGLSRTIDEKGNTYYTAVNHGKMTINSGVFSAPGVVSSMIENGYVDYKSTDAKRGYVIGENQEFPELVVNGGTFINGFYAIKNDDGAKLTINDGNFYGTILHNGIEMTINGGYFTVVDGTYPLSIRNLSDDLNPGKTIINNGVFDGNGYAIIKNSGEKPIDVQIKGGKFNLPVDEFIAEGYEQKFVDGYYVVSKKGE